MKKIMTIAAMLLIGATAFAQIHVGAGYTKGITKTNASDDNGLSNGFYAGASYNIPIVAGLGIAPGVYYNFLTAKENLLSFGSTSLDATQKEHYINIPVLVNYAFDLGTVKLFAYGGPTASFGVSSKLRYDVASGSNTADKTIDLYDDDYDYSRTDVKLGIGGGVQFGCFQVNVGYDWGMFDRDNSDNGKLHSNLLHAGVAYIF